MNKNGSTLIIYLVGKPGVGKYTVAKALSEKYGLIVCDNQLINNPIFELLQYDGYAKIPDFAWKAIARIRSTIFEFLTESNEKSYVLTNNLFENEGDKKLYEQVEKMANLRDSIFIPVRLTANEKEHLKRVTQHERRLRWKSIDPQDVYDQTPLLTIIHPNFLELDISNLNPVSAAEQIFIHIKKLAL